MTRQGTLALPEAPGSFRNRRGSLSLLPEPTLQTADVWGAAEIKAGRERVTWLLVLQRTGALLGGTRCLPNKLRGSPDPWSLRR